MTGVFYGGGGFQGFRWCYALLPGVRVYLKEKKEKGKNKRGDVGLTEKLGVLNWGFLFLLHSLVGSWVCGRVGPSSKIGSGGRVGAMSLALQVGS